MARYCTDVEAERQSRPKPDAGKYGHLNGERGWYEGNLHMGWVLENGTVGRMDGAYRSGTGLFVSIGVGRTRRWLAPVPPETEIICGLCGGVYATVGEWAEH